MSFEWRGQMIETDKEGFLLSQYQWTEELAYEIAHQEDVAVSYTHLTLPTIYSV